MKYLLDTHVWIWANSDVARLSAKIKKLLSQPDDNVEFFLSVFSIWEFYKLVEKGRITVTKRPDLWVKKALSENPVMLIPLNSKICYESTVLPQPFHQDPADQLIVASAKIMNATIITKDDKIIGYPHIKTIW
jgi:PIN domain nuclease of toxin-antitoxin system